MRGLTFLVAVTMAFSAHAQPTEPPRVPRLVVEVGPKSAFATNGYVGGQIVLKAGLISRHPFEALELKLPRLPDTEVIELQRPLTRKVTGYGGRGYVFETAIAIFPRTPGVLRIPSVTAVGFVEPEADNELAFDLASDPVEINISGVSRHFENPWWLVSDRVETEDAWSVPPADIRVGEVVQRTVYFRVWGVAAEHLPAVEHGRARGMKVSLAGRQLRTEKSPDGLIAHATYTWDLEAEPQQVAFITPIGLDYWDPVEHRARKAAVPALRLEPLAADSEKIAAGLMREAADQRNQTSVYGLLLIGSLGLPAIFLLGAYLTTWLPTPADRRLKASVAVDPSASNVYRAFDAWLTRSGHSKSRFDRHHTSRRDLSDQLFSGEQPERSARNNLISDAFRFSRRSRAKHLSNWLRTMVQP